MNRRFAALRPLPGQRRGCEWERLLHPDDVDDHRARWTAARQQGTIYENQYRLKNTEGISAGFSFGSLPKTMRRGDHQVERLLYDIEDLKLAEERVHLAQLEAHAAFWQWDLAQNVITWSREYHELCGLDESVRPL